MNCRLCLDCLHLYMCRVNVDVRHDAHSTALLLVRPIGVVLHERAEEID